MAPDGDDPLVVGVLYPPDFDPVPLLERLGPLRRPVDIRLGGYQDDAHLRILKRRGDNPAEIRALQPDLSPATVDALAGAEALLALDVPIDIVTLAPKLRWIQAFGAGVRQFNEKALWARDIRLTTAAGVGADPIAEFVIGRLLEVSRRFRDLQKMQQAHVWERMSGGAMLAGKTMGIVGLGAIGQAVARRAKAMDMRVIATRRRFETGMSAPNTDGLFGPDALDQLLATSDVVVLAVPETTETQDLISERELRLMKPGAVLCNVARGSVLDEGALVAALEESRLGAAILDVQRQEPLPVDSPLWDAPNIYLSPHSAASAEGYLARVVNIFADNLVRYIDGSPLINPVDRDAGY